MAYIKKGYTRKYTRGQRADYTTAFKEYRTQLSKRILKGSNINLTYSKESFEAFKRDFDRMFEAQRQDKREGLRKSNPTTKTVVREILDIQEYQFSKKQALAYRDWKALQGESITIRNARKSLANADNDFWNIIREERNALRESGIKSTDINAIISQEYFGSD